MKQLPPANVQTLFERCNNFLESIGIQRSSFQQQKCKLPQNISRRVPRKHRVTLHVPQDFPWVVMKDQLQQFRKRIAVRSMHPKIAAARSHQATCQADNSTVAQPCSARIAATSAPVNGFTTTDEFVFSRSTTKYDSRQELEREGLVYPELRRAAAF